jgi:hypothetical protein
VVAPEPVADIFCAPEIDAAKARGDARQVADDITDMLTAGLVGIGHDYDIEAGEILVELAAPFAGATGVARGR